MTNLERAVAVGFAGVLVACSARHDALGVHPGDAGAGDVSAGDADAGDTSDVVESRDVVAPGFLFYRESSSSELGACCWSCESLLDIENGSLVDTFTGAVPCQVSLTSAEMAAFAQLATRPDVVSALSDPSSCKTGGYSFAGISVGFDDGTVLQNQWISGCASGSPLFELQQAAGRLFGMYCTAGIICLNAVDAAAD